MSSKPDKEAILKMCLNQNGDNDINRAIYEAMESFSASQNSELKDQLGYCHKRMAEAYNEIDKIKSCLRSAEEELDDVKDEASDYKDSLTLLKQSNSELKKENEELKERVINLQQADMTHEYNNAEAERAWPQIEEQIREDERQKLQEEKDNEIERLKGLIEDAHEAGYNDVTFNNDMTISESWEQFKEANPF